MEANESMKTIRHLRRLSRTEAAERIGITLETLGRWERGETEPTLTPLVKMASIYQVSLNKLVGIEQIEI